MKTKMGISVGLMGAALYLVGIFNFLAMILLAGYVLLMEDNAWLKKSAVKVVAIVMCFALVNSILGLGSSLFGAINVIFGWFGADFTFRLSYPVNLDLLVLRSLDLLRDLVLIILAIKALTQGSLKVPLVDSIVDKNT